MPGSDSSPRAIPDPRVLRDSAVYIATTAKRLQLLADALEASPWRTMALLDGDPDPAPDGPSPMPGTPHWATHEARAALYGQGLHQALVEGARPYDYWLAAYVVGVRAADRAPDTPDGMPIPPFNFLKDLDPGR